MSMEKTNETRNLFEDFLNRKKVEGYSDQEALEMFIEVAIRKGKTPIID